MKNKRIVVIGTLLITIAAMIVASTSITTASDWPLYRNNPGNTAAIPETINLPLTEHWHSSAPAVEENGAVVYNNIVYMCSDASYLYAFNVSTGAILPGYPANIGFTYGSPSIDTIHNLVYVLCEDSYLYAFHLNGTTAWTKNVEGSGTNYNEGPLVDDGYVYVKEGGALQKYDYTGALQWSSLANGYNTQPSIMGNYVYTNDESGSIHKFNKTTGLETLTGGFPIPTGYSSSALTTVDGKIFHKADLLYAYDASNGNLLWSQPCGSSSTWYDSPAVSNGVVYV
jgi:outer membrane protein assembly factor BamB